MNRNKILVAIIGIGLLAFTTSCNKDQSAVKNLEGVWNITEITEDGVAQDLSSSTGTITFESCKLKTEGPCPASTKLTITTEALGITTIADSESEMTYSVSDKGAIMTATTVSTTSSISIAGFSLGSDNQVCESNCVIAYDILELTKSNLVIEGTDANGNVIKISSTK